MLDFFQACYLLSITWIALTFIFGELLDGIGDFDLDGLTLGVSFSSRSFLFGLVIFGVTGATLIERDLIKSSGLVMVIAALLGLIGGVFFEFVIIRPIKKMQSTSSVDENSLVGHEAELIEAASSKQIGKARLVINGNTLNFAARADSGEVIPKGTAVEILEISKGFVLVKPKKEKKED